MEEERLATELLKEVKAQAKRWFIAFCIMIGLEVLTITSFMLYLYFTTPEEETTTTTTQTVDDIKDGAITQIGGDSYGEGYSN